MSMTVRFPRLSRYLAGLAIGAATFALHTLVAAGAGSGEPIWGTSG
jgi:hypothetical protein